MSRNRSARRPRPSWAAAAPAFSAMPVRSAPAQNALSPAPVSTTTRTASSARARAMPSASPLITPYDIALRRSGRLIVTRAAPPSTSYSTSPVIAGWYATCGVPWPGHARARRRLARCAARALGHARLVHATARHGDPLGMAAHGRARDPNRVGVREPAAPLLAQHRVRVARRFLRARARVLRAQPRAPRHGDRTDRDRVQRAGD